MNVQTPKTPGVDQLQSIADLAKAGGNRFLFVPAIGMPKDLRTDSGFVFQMRIIRRVVARGNYVYVLLPHDCNLDTAPKIPGVFYLHVNTSAFIFNIQTASIDSAFVMENFSIPYGKYVVDAAIVMSGQQVLLTKQSIAPTGSVDVLPVFVIEPGVSWFETEPNFEGGRFDDELTVLGNSYAYMACVSKRDKRIALTKARHYDLSGHRLAQLEKNSLAGSAPVDINIVQSIAKQEKKYDVPTLLYASRTNATKHPELIVEVFDELYKQNEPFQVKYITQTSIDRTRMLAARWQLFDERQYIEPKTSAGPAEFYREAARSHVYMCWSDSESYNASAVEATLAGCAYLCIDTPEFRELYDGDLGGDVFWFKDKYDAIEKVRWVAKNYDKAYEMQEGLRHRFIEQQTNGDISKFIHETVGIHHRENLRTRAGRTSYFLMGPQSEMMGIVRGILENWPKDEITLQDVIAGLMEHCRNFLESNEKRAFTSLMPLNWQLHQTLKLHFGLVDTCESRHPKYRLPKE